MKRLSPIEFVLYRLGLAGNQEKKNVWVSKESDSMLSEKWDEASFDGELIPNLNAPMPIEGQPQIVVWKKWLMAASILIPITLSVLFFQNNRNTITLATAYGETREVLLSDGSTVYLNSGSTISYPSEFDQNIRKVIFTGEAFFNIKSNPNKAFIVEMPNSAVEVLGTSFNCNTHSKDEIESVSLKSGVVNFIVNDKAFKLKPGERFELNTKTREVEKQKLNPKNIGNWQDGYLTFENSDIREVSKSLERKYNVKIDVNKNLGSDQKINLSVKSESLNEILEILKITAKIDYSTQTNGRIILTNPN